MSGTSEVEITHPEIDGTPVMIGDWLVSFDPDYSDVKVFFQVGGIYWVTNPFGYPGEWFVGTHISDIRDYEFPVGECERAKK